MPVIRSTNAPTFTVDGFHFVGLTSPSRGASELCTWRSGDQTSREERASLARP